MPGSILMFYCDDCPAQILPHIGMRSGYKVLNLLQRMGTTFSANFAVSSQCSPSRASFLTGQYAHHHGLYGNQATDPHDYAGAIDESKLLPVALVNAGYKCGYFGKYINDQPPKPQGWDRWVAGASAQFTDYSLDEDGTPVAYGSDPDDYFQKVVAAKARDWIAARIAAEEPYFAVIGFMAPHLAAVPHEDYAGAVPEDVLPPALPGGELASSMPGKPAYIKGLTPLSEVSADSAPANYWPTGTDYDTAAEFCADNYRRMIECMHTVDEEVGRTLEILGDTLDDTLIIFTADHGFNSGEFNLLHKVVPYHASIHTPLVIRGPGVLQDVVRTEITNSSIDITATILDFAEATPLATLDGLSLMDLMGEADFDDAWRPDGMLIEFVEDHVQAWPSYTVPAFSGVVSYDLKYVKYTGAGELELYDLENDPHELFNKAGDPLWGSALSSIEAVRVALGGL